MLFIATGLGIAGDAESDVVAAGDDASLAEPRNDWAAHLLPIPGVDKETARLFGALREALGVQALDEAEVDAKQLVTQVMTRFAGNLVLRCRTLHDLAVVQHLRAEYPAAIRNYRESIDVISDSQDMLSAELVEPLHGLGIAYADSGDPVAAFRTFERARHISNVNQGPHSLAQVPLLQSIVRLHEDQGDLQSAEDALARIYQLHLRAYSADAEELLPVLRQQAGLYKRHGMLDKEYEAWNEVLHILRKHLGKNDLALVEPQLSLGRNMIKRMAHVKFSSGPTAPSAEKYLKRALAIAMHNPRANWQIQRRAMLALADYYMLLGAPARGRRYYALTWRLLTDNKQFTQRVADLDANVPLFEPRPNPYANFEYNPDLEKIDPADYQSGLMVAEFTINKRGHTQDVEIVEQNPPDFQRMQWRLTKSLRGFVFRPRFVDGKAVSTDKYQYRLEYYYLPSEYRASLATSGRLNRPHPPEYH